MIHVFFIIHIYVCINLVYLSQHIHTEAKKDITYTLQRLVKGLSSSRESARLGFASCLVQVLAQSPDVKLQDVMVLIEDNTKLTGIHIYIYIYIYMHKTSI